MQLSPDLFTQLQAGADKFDLIVAADVSYDPDTWLQKRPKKKQHHDQFIWEKQRWDSFARKWGGENSSQNGKRKKSSKLGPFSHRWYAWNQAGQQPVQFESVPQVQHIVVEEWSSGLQKHWKYLFKCF